MEKSSIFNRERDFNFSKRRKFFSFDSLCDFGVILETFEELNKQTIIAFVL